jgi:DNA repair protein RadC
MRASRHSIDDRPREKLSRRGVGSLGDREILALVIGHGVAGRSALDIAEALLTDVGGIHGLTRATVIRLVRAAGIGVAQASRVIAAVELGRRTLHVPLAPRLPLQTPAALGEFLLPRFGAHAVERFGVVLLDARHRLMHVHMVSEGGLDVAVAVPRDVFREATQSGAAAVVLFHNHPSGDPEPSRDDLLLTRRLIHAGRIVGIDVVDHLILGDTEYCSLRLRKML